MQWIRDKLANWWNGRVVFVEFDNDPESSLVILPTWHTEYHWTAIVARACVKFYLAQWQFVWSTIIGLIGLWAAIAALK
jgi:hypothetical protein